MKKRLLLTIFTLLVFNLGFTQSKKQSNNTKKTSVFSESLNEAKVFAPNGVIRCASTEYQNSKKANGKVASDKAFEEWLAPKIQEIKRLRQLGRLPSVITIPVVVHVIHNGDAIGSGENISDAQVLSQITVFNQDFRKMAGTPGNGAGVDTMIQFCMAQVDPNGNPTTGIDRRQFTTASYNGAAVETRKASTIWDPTKYLNMWTFRFGGDLASVLGYAQFPSGSGLEGMPEEDCITGEASTDGVVCAYTTWGSSSLATGSFGAPYDKGRTMTHEVGHMLGLRHIWGDGGCGVDDFCADTPLSDAANFSCPTTNSCTDSPIDYNDQVQNYMDYTDDTCMSMFTQDQSDRMLAVLMNSPRRDDLLVSTVCTPVSQPYIQFKRQACESRAVESVLEGNGCSYTEFTVPLNIDKAPSANAVVTFSIDGASVANANDIQIMTPSVTFNSGSTADKNLVFRVLNDGYVESDEELMITFTVNNGGGNAIENPEGKVFSMTILNDDSAVSINSNGSLFSENFDPQVNTLNIFDVDGDTKSWTVTNEAAFGTSVGFDGNFALSLSWDNSGPLTPNNYLVTNMISIPSNATSVTLNFDSGTLEADPFQYEHYAVYVGAGNTPAVISTQTPVLEETLSVAESFSTHSIDLSSFAGQDVYLAFRHFNTSDMNTLIIDDISVNYTSVTSIQTATDIATPGQSTLNGSGTASYKDSASSNIITSVSINDTNNYGCTTASVSRAGTSGVQYGASTNTADFAMSKQFTITPANVINGSSTITFYFTEAEVAGWEAFTGKTRSQLYVVKDGLSQEIQSLTLGAFGSGVTMTATFTTGVDGVYSFATQAVLSTDNFGLVGFALYPNPNNGTFNIQFASTSSSEIKVNVHDMRGREIFNKAYQNNGLFNESLQLNNVQSGIYLVTVQDGARKEVKKIVVE